MATNNDVNCRTMKKQSRHNHLIHKYYYILVLLDATVFIKGALKAYDWGRSFEGNYFQNFQKFGDLR